MNPMSLFRASVRTSIEGPEVTWAGANPSQSGQEVCLGFDNGTLLFPSSATSGQPARVTVSKEAINGVAFIGSSSIAISTRAEVTFIEVITPQNVPRAVFSGGAHGVVATKSGYFIAPLGIHGLLLVKPDRGPEQKMRVTTGMDRPLYFYRMTALHDVSGRETLVFANRRHGVGLSRFHGSQEKRGVHTLCFDGLDVVDVCGIADGSLSAIAISPKAEVLWIRDSSTHDNPITTKLTGVEGKIYRVLATSQTLFVLSDKALYVWQGLVHQVFSQLSTHRRLQPLVIPMEAIDMSIVGDYLLLVLAENGIASLPLSNLEVVPVEHTEADSESRHAAEMSRRAHIEDLTPTWERHESQQGILAVK